MNALGAISPAPRSWRLPLLAPTLAATLLPLVPAAAQPPVEPTEPFLERVDVTAVEVMIDVRDRDGLRVRGLGPEDFEVMEDGEPMQVVGVDYPLPPGLAPPAASPEDAGIPGAGGAGARKEPEWRFLVYFDLVLTQKRSVKRAIETLDNRLDQLVAMGAVEVVVANPTPEIAVPFTRDAKRLRQELGRIANEPVSHQLASIRRDFLHMLDMRLHIDNPGPSETAAVLNQIRTSVNKEFLLLNRRLITLGQWIGAYGHAPASVAILVSDGFDLAPGDFYLQASSLPQAEPELGLELNRFRVDPLAEALAREIAARGWTSVLMALGGTSELATSDASMSYRDRFRSIGEPSALSAGPGSGSPTFILQNPLEPLMMVSDKTGGELMTARKTAEKAIVRISERVRLTYLAPRPRDGQVHRVAIRAKSAGITVRASEWVRSPTREQIAAARARRLLLVDTTAGELPVRLAVTRLEPSGERATSRATVEIFFDLNLVRAVLPRPGTPMVFTFGIDVPAAPPLAHEVRQLVALPAERGEVWPDFLYTVALDLPSNATRLSVVVEEPASGIWGGTTRKLSR